MRSMCNACVQLLERVCKKAVLCTADGYFLQTYTSGRFFVTSLWTYLSQPRHRQTGSFVSVMGDLYPFYTGLITKTIN